MSKYLRAARRSFPLSLEAMGALGALLFLVAPAVNSQQRDIPPVLKIGAKAPDFTLPNPVDGKTYSLKDFDAAKVLVVVLPVTIARLPKCTKTGSRRSPRIIAIRVWHWSRFSQTASWDCRSGAMTIWATRPRK